MVQYKKLKLEEYSPDRLRALKEIEGLEQTTMGEFL
jgi:hypothetical protein